jgi:hypothetical protein
VRTLIVPPLPNPADAAVRQREQVERISTAGGNRLLFVSALENGMVVLEEADGTLIDEPIPWIGAYDPVVGDKVIRIGVPGRGSKHAAPAYVAIGPVTSSALTGRTLTVSRIAGDGDTASVAVGAAMGTSPGAITASGTDLLGTVIQNAGTSTANGILWTVTYATPRTGTPRPFLQAVSSGAADANLYVTNRTGTGFNIACRNAPAASSQIAAEWWAP